jgi:F-box protein 21
MGNDGITFRPEAPVSLTSLPDEVLQHILYFVSPNHVLQNVQRVSKRFYTLGSEPVLWRYHCQAQFKYWDPKHRIGLKFLGCAGNVDWKTLFIHRQKVNSQTTCILDSILQGQVNRIKKFSEIIDFGYDAKDILLQHCRTNEGAEDVLARRYLAISLSSYATL